MAVTNSNISLSVPRFKNPTFIKIMSALWWFIAILGILLYIVLLPFNWNLFQTGVSSIDITSDWNPQYGIALIEGLAQLGIPVTLYAAFKILVSIFIMAVYYGMGFLIFRTGFQERIGMQAAFCFVALGAFLGMVSGAETFYEIAWLDGFINLGGWILAIFGWGTLYMFLPLYPDGRFVPRWSIIAPLTWLGTIIVTIIAPTSEWAGGGDSTVISFILFLGMIGVPLLAQIYRYFRVSTPLQRQQTKWFIYTLTLFLTMVMISTFITVDRLDPMQAVLADLGDILPGILFTLFPLSIGLAILRYRLWDVDVVINKSLVYGAVVILAIGIFFVTSTVIQVIFSNQQIWVALLFSIIVSGAIFKPVSRRVQTFVDRYIYRLRFDLNELGRAQEPLSIINPGMLTGQQFGDYEVQGVIGKGGMGEVYDGFANGQRVAIKTMLPEIAKDPALKIRFEREVEIGISLKTPHIAEIYSSGEHNGIPYLVMEYIEGQDLGDIIKAQGKFDTETAIQIITDICEALSLAHEQGYVHRDLKPSNIMLRENGAAVLMDFGISKIQDAKTITGTGAVGTIQYMAPEQIISSKDVDHRADIYALGCVLYQMLTGETPFSGGAAQVMFAQIQQPAPDPRDIQPDIPEHLADAILKALEKDPEKRFNSAMEFPVFVSG